MTSPADAVAALYASPTSTCDWAIEQCHMIGLPPKKCERFGCLKYLHHVCSIQWAAKNNLPEDGIATLCRAHHPQYKKYVTAAAATVSTASDTITGGVISPPMPASMDLTDILDDAFISRTDDHDEPPHPEIGRLRAEKRQLLIQKCTLVLGHQNDDLKNALAESIAEVEEEISTYTKQLSEVDMQTPQKSNRSPDCD